MLPSSKLIYNLKPFKSQNSLRYVVWNHIDLLINCNHVRTTSPSGFRRCFPPKSALNDWVSLEMLLSVHPFMGKYGRNTLWYRRHQGSRDNEDLCLTLIAGIGITHEPKISEWSFISHLQVPTLQSWPYGRNHPRRPTSSQFLPPLGLLSVKLLFVQIKIESVEWNIITFLHVCRGLQTYAVILAIFFEILKSWATHWTSAWYVGIVNRFWYISLVNPC